jgi:hypothetical protein
VFTLTAFHIDGAASNPGSACSGNALTAKFTNYTEPVCLFTKMFETYMYTRYECGDDLSPTSLPDAPSQQPAVAPPTESPTVSSISSYTTIPTMYVPSENNTDSSTFISMSMHTESQCLSSTVVNYAFYKTDACVLMYDYENHGWFSRYINSTIAGMQVYPLNVTGADVHIQNTNIRVYTYMHTYTDA